MHNSERSSPKKPNRLIGEKSPYLLQHAYNPVAWFPWGEDAFQKARTEQKPVFLSVGYSTCYWCHVMEREVFENESLASLMNELVVSIKVDREERPDIDRIYMSALQAMSGSGGWPMSMFLTPDLKPFFGATYIPPVQQHGRPGFADILRSVHEVWTNERGKVLEAADRATEYITQLSMREHESVEPGEKAFDTAFQQFHSSYDNRFGGFGGAPKFPRPSAINFLFRYYARKKNLMALDMSLTTLRRMAHGGMYDHVGGGFHRYSTDERWHVPHFEKMLYDQGQLIVSYLEAFQITHDEFFSNVAVDILEYVLRDLAHPDGGFYSAEDAESAPDVGRPAEKSEGAFYIWTEQEIRTLLTREEADAWCRCYGVRAEGNVIEDPHGVFRGKNVLAVVHTAAEVAKQLSIAEETAKHLLVSARKKLFDARSQRPRCHLDDKILTSWNGLMIRALAKAHQVLRDPRYLEAAIRCAMFLLKHLTYGPARLLVHRYRDGEARIDGQLDDYAFLLQACIDLYESSFDIQWLKEALRLAEAQNRLFFDHERGGFFDTSGDDASLLVRTKEWYDGAEPSGNSIAILNLLRLAQFTNNQSLETLAGKSFSCFGEQLMSAGHALPQMLVAFDFEMTKPMQIILAGATGDPRTQELLRVVHSEFLPNKVLMLADGAAGQTELAIFIPIVSSLQQIAGNPTAYVCENYACQLPTADPSVLKAMLTGAPGSVGSLQQ